MGDFILETESSGITEAAESGWTDQWLQGTKTVTDSIAEGITLTSSTITFKTKLVRNAKVWQIFCNSGNQIKNWGSQKVVTGLLPCPSENGHYPAHIHIPPGHRGCSPAAACQVPHSWPISGRWQLLPRLSPPPCMKLLTHPSSILVHTYVKNLQTSFQD